MSLIARAPSTLSSSTSETPGKRSWESLGPLSAQAKMYDRTVKPVVCFDISHEQRHHHRFVESKASYSEWDDDKAWSSQEWKSDELLDRTEATRCLTSTRSTAIRRWGRRNRIRFVIRIQIILEQGEWSSAKKAKTIFNECCTRQRKTFMSWTLESSVFMGKNCSDNWHSIKNTKDLTMKQMFDISAKLVSEQDEICGVKTIDWVNSSWKYLSLTDDEQIIKLQRTEVYVFSDSVLCLGKTRTLDQTWHGQRLEWFKSSPEYRTLDRIDGEPMEFEWNIFPVRYSSVKKFKSLLKLNETPEISAGRIIFMSMFNDISWWSKDNKIECESNVQLVSIFARRFGAGQWSFLGPRSEKKWYSITEDSPQGEWDKMAEKMKRTPSLPEYGRKIKIKSLVSGRKLNFKPGRRGSHTTAWELQMCPFQGPGTSNTTKIPRKEPQRDTATTKRWREREEKARNFGPPTLRGSTLRGPTFLGLSPKPIGIHPLGHPSGPHPSGPHPSGPHPSVVCSSMLFLLSVVCCFVLFCCGVVVLVVVVVCVVVCVCCVCCVCCVGRYLFFFGIICCVKKKAGQDWTTNLRQNWFGHSRSTL